MEILLYIAIDLLMDIIGLHIFTHEIKKKYNL